MSRRTVGLWTVVTVLAAASPARANEVPGFYGVLVLWSIPPVMALCTFLGGGYAILRRVTGERRTAGLTERAKMGVIYSGAYLISLTGIFALLSWLFFLGSALGRGGRMLVWGVKACRKSVPEHLGGASPVRLLVAGGTLIPMSLLLMVCAADFWTYTPLSQDEVDRNFARLTASSIALARIEGEGSGGARLPEVDDSLIERLDDNPRDYNIQSMSGMLRHYKRGNLTIERTEGGRRFALYLPPRATLNPFMGRIPRWFNRFVTFSTWRSDETGAIRMRLTHVDERCPADAPVVRQVSEEEIRREIKRLRRQSAAAASEKTAPR